MRLRFDHRELGPASTHLPPLLRGVQLLLDLRQRRLLAGRRGGPQLRGTIEGRRLQDDLEGLAARALAQLNDLHVPDVAQVQVHHACKKTASFKIQNLSGRYDDKPAFVIVSILKNIIF